jgi:polyisoprenoid-binding protein YceI
MYINSRISRISLSAVLLLLTAPALAFSANKSIKVGDGTESGGHSTVNGSVTVGRDATVDGSLETVNGTIRIDQNSVVRDVETVNGSIRIAAGVSTRDVSSVNGSVRLAENVTVDGEVAVVNGKIGLAAGSKVSSSVSNVNGQISVAGAEIGGNLTTVNGDVGLSDQATLRGDLVIQKSRGWNSNTNGRKPEIVIGPGSTVVGQIKLEREVSLFISDTAVVGGVSGVMSMDDVVRFSGKQP